MSVDIIGPVITTVTSINMTFITLVIAQLCCFYLEMMTKLVLMDSWLSDSWSTDPYVSSVWSGHLKLSQCCSSFWWSSSGQGSSRNILYHSVYVTAPQESYTLTFLMGNWRSPLPRKFFSLPLKIQPFTMKRRGMKVMHQRPVVSKFRLSFAVME